MYHSIESIKSGFRILMLIKDLHSMELLKFYGIVIILLLTERTKFLWKLAL